ncbi:HlyD family secretion protein [Marinobacterium aestuariivivens]|uniref:HlyD family secretion protein n=1 Tax=Marinobacterium aestuariivivens TaxID=1698799 RepID=A0ABW2A8M2_9GAMM
MTGKAWVWTALTIAAVAVASYILFRVLSPTPLPEGILYGSGHIEGTEIRVSAETSGRVLDSRMEEGQPVRAGELLASLDDRELRIRQALTEAELAAIRQGIQARQAQLEVWHHHVDTAASDHERFLKLRQTGAATPQQLAGAEDRLKEAQGQVRFLQAQLAESEARLQAARQNLRLLKLQLEKTQIRAPVDGTLIVKAIEAGELASQGTAIAMLVDLSRLRLRVYISERLIGRVRLGNEARVRIDAFPDRYFEARVSLIDQRAQFTPRDVHLPEERARMVFGIELSLDNSDGFLKPGMPADAWIRWTPDQSWPERLEVPR